MHLFHGPTISHFPLFFSIRFYCRAQFRIHSLLCEFIFDVCVHNSRPDGIAMDEISFIKFENPIEDKESKWGRLLYGFRFRHSVRKSTIKVNGNYNKLTWAAQVEQISSVHFKSCNFYQLIKFMNGRIRPMRHVEIGFGNLSRWLILVSECVSLCFNFWFDPCLTAKIQRGKSWLNKSNEFNLLIVKDSRSKL